MPLGGILNVMRKGKNKSSSDHLILAAYEKKLSDLRKHSAFHEMDVFNQVLFEIFHVSILPTLLRNYDRYSMASGVEVRMPFMDWRLVCLAFSLPWPSKIGNTFTKRIHRDAMSNILPETVRCRRDKLGWNSPMHEWLRGPLRSQINTLLSDSPDTNSDLTSDWNRFQLSPQVNYKDGELIWTKILPVIWKQSFF